MLTSIDIWLAFVAWRFWLGALSNKGGRGQRNREEIGAGATWNFLFLSRFRRSCARLDKTAMLRRLIFGTFLSSCARFSAMDVQCQRYSLNSRCHPTICILAVLAMFLASNSAITCELFLLYQNNATSFPGRLGCQPFFWRLPRAMDVVFQIG